MYDEFVSQTMNMNCFGCFILLWEFHRRQNTTSLYYTTKPVSIAAGKVFQTGKYPKMNINTTLQLEILLAGKGKEGTKTKPN